MPSFSSGASPQKQQHNARRRQLIRQQRKALPIASVRKSIVEEVRKNDTLRTYEMQLLGEEEALSVFCRSALDQECVPHTADKKLVKQVAAECRGLPLALKVIGASLRDQTPMIWLSAKNRLSRGESISDSHETKLLERMAASIECLSGKLRECFPDLGCFPEDKKIPLDVLISIWMEIHDLDGPDAFAILVELLNKNLLTLVNDAQNKAGDCTLAIMTTQ